MDDEHTTHRRVKFDFEVDFSNGGGLQGQDFRLDIEGEDISEEELARRVSRRDVWEPRRRVARVVSALWLAPGLECGCGRRACGRGC
jgi:hypothetical protein